jgi:uncharacterized repeat protein (TIGR03803 family)
MKRLNWLSQVVLLVVCFATVVLPAQAQFIQGPNGDSYYAVPLGGVGYCGGISGQGCGTIVDDHTNTTLYSFCSVQNCADGWEVNPQLLLGPDGNFYGTTALGGGTICHAGYGCGTIFEISPVFPYPLTTLYQFCLAGGGCADGSIPVAGLTQGPGTTLYGTTSKGGAHGLGTIFKILTASGRPATQLITLYSFDGTNGSNPTGNLTLGSDGNFHGTTSGGGAYGQGTAFEITPGGTFTLLQSFGASSSGSNPNGGLSEGSQGIFYGTTSAGGIYGYGTVFKITPSGTLSTLKSLGGISGATPYAGLVRATDGNFYGTTYAGGAAGDGTAFKITPSGKLTTLKSFNGKNGSFPVEGLMQDTNGNLYGITSKGGTKDDGTVFKLSVGLAPFVETLPTASTVGAQIWILGTDLKGTTSVTFNGIQAAFKVKSRSEIVATVPNGATTGEVVVVTPKGKLMSNVPFQVINANCSGGNKMIYSNLGPSNAAFDYISGSLISGPGSPLGSQQWIGFPFTPTENHTATEIDAAAFYYGNDGSAGNNFNFGIWSDSAGAPGTEIASVDVANLPTFTGTSGDCCNTQNATIAATALTAGTQYWVVLSTDGNGMNSLGVWDYVYNDASGTLAYNDGSGWNTIQGTASAFAVCGSN